MLEREILHSMVHYPHFIGEFLSEVSLKCFSKKGLECLNLINTLQDKGALSINSFVESLSVAQRSDEFYIELLSSAPNANFLSLKESFIKAHKLALQREIAHKLLLASDNKELLDIDLLISSDKDMLAYKNMNEWLHFYAQKGAVEKFKSGIVFLDSVFEGGFEGAQLILISGEPEAGKTTLGVQILEYMAKSRKVGFFCFEFTIEQYLKDKDAKRFNFENMIILNDGYELSSILQNIKNLYRQGVKVFLIDSQMRISSPNGRNMEEEESLKFSSLARLCHSLGILVFLIVQTSKGDRDNPMGSKKGGHEASIILRLEHSAAKSEMREFNEEERVLILKKNKQTGKHYKEKVRFNPALRRFENLSREVESDAEKISLEDINKLLSSFS